MTVRLITGKNRVQPNEPVDKLKLASLGVDGVPLIEY